MSVRDDFTPLLGNWTGVEQQSASPWAPAARTRSMITFKADLADTAVVQDYRQVRDDGNEFAGHGVFLAEPGSARVLWWFFDSYALPPTPAVGEWDRGELVLEKTTPRGTAVHRFRVTEDQLQYDIALRSSTAEFEPFLIGSYARISGH